jgi:hypothetical protein
MTETVELSPFFDRGETSRDGFPAESYVAGYRGRNGASVGVTITLPAKMVEHTVLTGSRLTIWLSLDGRLVFDGEGLGDETLEAASVAGGLNQLTLESLVAASLNPQHLAAEDDPIADLTQLRAQLIRALAQLDGALERLEPG